MNVLTSPSSDEKNPHAIWQQNAEKMISHYKERPIVIEDHAVMDSLQDRMDGFKDANENSFQENLDALLAKMAKRTFHRYLDYDIICIQEADDLDRSFFPESYAVLFSSEPHSVNGIAWKKERFEKVKDLVDIGGRAICLKLRDNETGETLLVTSGHLSGCNPFRVELDPQSGTPDSTRGDQEIRDILETMQGEDADFKLIALDANVTSLHPRMKIIRAAGYELDCNHFIEPTCTNPYHVLQTRIDWIALQKSSEISASITNIPVWGVGLNSIETNISDHKPIAAKISVH